MFHVLNRGNDQRTISGNEDDYAVFLRLFGRTLRQVASTVREEKGSREKESGDESPHSKGSQRNTQTIRRGAAAGRSVTGTIFHLIFHLISAA